MKKKVYIMLFVILGLLLQLLVHALLELNYLNLLIGDFSKYSFGLSWSQLFIARSLITISLILLGVAFGLWQGRFWWKKVYEDPNFKGMTFPPKQLSEKIKNLVLQLRKQNN